MSATFRLAFSALVAASGVALAAEPAPAGSATALLRQLDAGFVEVFEKVAPSVVVIEATKQPDPEDGDLRELDRYFEGREARGKGDEPEWPLPGFSEGSGFIIRADGYVLTNHHVVAETKKLTVRLRDGRTFPGEIVGFDERTDIAIVRIPARDLPAAPIGDSDAVRVGQLVCAIGAPFNQHFSFSVGWLSGKGRTNLLGPSSSTVLYEDYLQTDTFINPGNSGGPLFDVEGRVIGMNTLINGLGRGLAFAIPSATFQEVARQIIAHGRIQRPWLGISMRAREGAERGAVVDRIEADSPAIESPLQVMDVIVAIDGDTVNAPLDVLKALLRKKVGATVQLTVARGGTTLRVPVVTREVPPAKLAPAANARPGKLALDQRAEILGLELRDARPAGATVAAILPDSPADRAELRADDVIVEVGGRPVRDAASAAGAIGDRLRVAPDKPIALNIERKGAPSVVLLKP